MTYTIYTNGQKVSNLTQGKALRIVRVLKQQKQEFLLVTEK